MNSNNRSGSNATGVSAGSKQKSYGRTDTARTCSLNGRGGNNKLPLSKRRRNQSSGSAGVTHRPLTSVVLTALAALCLCSCAEVPQQPRSKTVRARVTFYSKHEDKYGSRIAIGGRAKEGLTVAAPRALAFGTKVSLPQVNGIVGNGHFEIQDRGSALEKAYRHGQLRIDIYVASMARMRSLGRTMPEYMEAELCQ